MVCSLPRVLHVYIKDYDTKFHLKNVANLTKHASKETSNEFAGSADHEGVVAKCRCLGAQVKRLQSTVQDRNWCQRKEGEADRKKERARARERGSARARETKRKSQMEGERESDGDRRGKK